MSKNFDPAIGLNTQFKKGQLSRNPGGRPKKAALTDALIAVLGQLQGVPVRLDRIVEQLFLRIVGAQAEVVEREFGMQAETRGLEVGVGRLRSLLRSSNAAANAAQRSTS